METLFHWPGKIKRSDWTGEEMKSRLQVLNKKDIATILDSEQGQFWSNLFSGWWSWHHSMLCKLQFHFDKIIKYGFDFSEMETQPMRLHLVTSTRQVGNAEHEKSSWLVGDCWWVIDSWSYMSSDWLWHWCVQQVFSTHEVWMNFMTLIT